MHGSLFRSAATPCSSSLTLRIFRSSEIDKVVGVATEVSDDDFGAEKYGDEELMVRRFCPGNLLDLS